MPKLPSSAAILMMLACLASCAATSSNAGFSNPDEGGVDGGSVAMDGSSVVADAGPPAPVLTGDGSTVDATPDPGRTLLYVHDATSLYQVDPMDPNLAITSLGKFSCIGGKTGASSMTDLAVDKDGKLYGISTQALFLDMQVGASGVTCNLSTSIVAGAAGSKATFYGASFAPPGPLDPVNETLIVGNTNGELYMVDTKTGTLTLVGTFGNVPADDGNGHTYAAANVGKAWEMSGDIVFLSNAGKPVGFAAVRDCPNPPATTNCNTTDTLLEIDLSKLSATSPVVVTSGTTMGVRGQIVKDAGCADTANTSYGSMYGIAAYGSDIIGFSKSGLIVKIDDNKGGACLVADDSAMLANKGFDGAGVTTRAPVMAPPPVN